MGEAWVCIDCGARQSEQGACHACAHEVTLDLGDPEVRRLMRDVERRLAERRDSKFRTIGILYGMGIVFALWLVPGYWEARSMSLALPVLLDQWLFMALIGFAVARLLARVFGRPRFPYLQADLSIR
jgi:hypothetical protein